MTAQAEHTQETRSKYVPGVGYETISLSPSVRDALLKLARILGEEAEDETQEKDA